VIVVLGRPHSAPQDGAGLGGRAARLAVRLRTAGAQVELVGSVGDDAAGDAVVACLGRAGIGHAALLRDPAGRTPVDDPGADTVLPEGPLPRLDAADLAMGLSYVADCRVIVAVEDLDPDAWKVVADAAAYHDASLVVLVSGEALPALPMGSRMTLLETPDDDEREAIDDLNAQYAAFLDQDVAEAEAFRRVRQSMGIERVGS
jgi:hypothetical protein